MKKIIQYEVVTEQVEISSMEEWDIERDMSSGGTDPFCDEIICTIDTFDPGFATYSFKVDSNYKANGVRQWLYLNGVKSRTANISKKQIEL